MSLLRARVSPISPCITVTPPAVLTPSSLRNCYPTLHEVSHQCTTSILLNKPQLTFLYIQHTCHFQSSALKTQKTTGRSPTENFPAWQRPRPARNLSPDSRLPLVSALPAPPSSNRLVSCNSSYLFLIIYCLIRRTAMYLAP